MWPGAFILFALAAAYFSLGWSLSMEWMDQGQLLYPSWRVAEGAVPLRDFAQMYGPSTFLFLGLLMRAFGSDVLVVRVSLIALKAAIAVLAYAYTRRIASRAGALAAFALAVAVLGTPWWIFNTPYPNHYGLAFNLAGFLVLLACPRRPFLGSLVAGLLFGISATFKQTLGLFALVAVLWFALYERDEPAPERPAWQPSPSLMTALGALRLAALGASLLLFVAYVARHPDAWTDAVLIGPVVAAVGILALREKRFAPLPADHVRALSAVAGAGAGFAIPVVVCVAYYAAIGALDALFFSTVTVPAAMDWFVPIEPPKARTALLAVAAVAAALAASRVARAVRAGSGAIALAALGAFAVSVSTREGIGHYLRTEAWIGEVFSLVFWLPVVLCLAELVEIGLAQRLRGTALRPPRATEAERGAVLMTFYGIAALQHLYPAGDFWHLLNMLPVYTILFGHQLDRLRAPRDATRRVPGRVAPALVRGALVASLAFPFAYALLRARLDRPAGDASIPRATGIRDASPKFGHAAELVAYLSAPERSSRSLLVVANEQMLYFVAGRRSVWDGREFLLYLVEAGLLHGERARELLDEAELLGRLESERPLLVDDRQSQASARLWSTFPILGQAVAERYQPTAQFGGYVVLDEGPS